jgi:hypothetical protein
VLHIDSDYFDIPVEIPIMSEDFQVQKALPEKHGSMVEKGRGLGNMVTRYYKIGWAEGHAVLHYYETADMEASGRGKTISLQQYVSKYRAIRLLDYITYLSLLKQCICKERFKP